MGLSNELSCEAGSFLRCCLNPQGVFNQWFEALFPRAGALGCVVCFAPPLFFLVYLHGNVGLPSLQASASKDPPAAPCQRAAALPALLHNPPPCWIPQSPPVSTQLRVSAPPTGLDECVFFNFLVVGLPYSLIFCQF